MAKKTKFRTIKGKLGLFGWISRIVLLIFNAAMIGWVVSLDSNVDRVQDRVGTLSGDERDAVMGISIIMIVGVWAAGTVILGIWALLTRPARTLVPIEDGK